MKGRLNDLWHDPDVPVVLRTSLTSPFGRKVRMALSVLRLGERVSVEHADTLDAADSLRGQNPLGKIPCLLIGEEVFFDSHVILELLDELAGGGRLLPAVGLGRYQELTTARLADGVTEAALLMVYEGRFRTPEQRSQIWLDHQSGKVHRGLAAIEKIWPDPRKTNLVAITLAAGLGYLDWRQPVAWRDEFPRLGTWLETFAANEPAWAATERTEP